MGTETLALRLTNLGKKGKKTRYKKLVTHVESHVRSVSLLKRAENSAI